MANEFELSPKELKRQADALLAAADAAEKAAEREPAARSAKKSTRKKGEETAQEAPAVMTDEEARKAGILRLDDKQVAALPAASWLMNNEKLRELLARGKKKGKLDSADLMDAVDDLNLESDQMDQLYDSLEALNIDISADDALLADLPDDEPAAEEIADVEEEELVDPNTLVNSFSIDDPVRMYLKEIGKVPLLSRMRRSTWPRPWARATRPTGSWRRLTGSGRRGRRSLTPRRRSPPGSPPTPRVRPPSRSWRRPTSAWWCPSPSGTWAGACCSWI